MAARPSGAALRRERARMRPTARRLRFCHALARWGPALTAPALASTGDGYELRLPKLAADLTAGSNPVDAITERARRGRCGLAWTRLPGPVRAPACGGLRSGVSFRNGASFAAALTSRTETR
jgi:hypothetical protein